MSTGLASKSEGSPSGCVKGRVRIHRRARCGAVSVEAGRIRRVLGPSECGKSTLLAALAGHVGAHAGRATLDGKPSEGPHPERGMVFQQHTLLPWASALDNVAFGLKMRRPRRRERAAPPRGRCSSWSASAVRGVAIRRNCRAACSSARKSRAR